MFTNTYGPVRVEYKRVINRFQTIEDAFRWAEQWVATGDVFHINGTLYCKG